MCPHLNQGNRDSKPWLDCSFISSIHLNVFAYRIEKPTAQNNPQIPSCSKNEDYATMLFLCMSICASWVPGRLPQSWKKLWLNWAYGVSAPLSGAIWALVSGSQLIRTLIRDCSFSTHRRTTNYSPALMEPLSLSAQLLNSLMHWCIQFELRDTQYLISYTWYRLLEACLIAYIHRCTDAFNLSSSILNTQYLILNTSIKYIAIVSDTWY